MIQPHSRASAKRSPERWTTLTHDPPLALSCYPNHHPYQAYHIIRRTLWPIKGHSSSAKLEGAMKTLVFYILNGINFNARDFFIHQFAASGLDIFGLKFYAPWVMRLIKLHSDVKYQPSACNHVIFLPKVDMSVEAIYPEPAKEAIYLCQSSKFLLAC